jgi:type II secretion system protein H
MTSTRPRRNAGFSLIEAMVVLVVLGIVLAAAIPDFTKSNRRRSVESAATTLSSRIQVARQRAIATDPTNTDVEFESRGTVLEEDTPLGITFMNAVGDTFFLSLVRTGRVVVRPGAP